MTSNKKDFVEKLDTDKFNTIVTGLKTKETLPQNVQKKVTTLWNKVNSGEWFGEKKNKKKKTSIIKEGSNSLLWIDTYREDVKRLINETWTSDTISHTSTLRAYLEAFSNILLAVNKKRNKEFTRPFWTYSKVKAKEKEARDDENELSEQDKANFVCFEDIVQVRDDRYQKLQEKNTFKNSQLHLILALNTYIPPLRINITKMKIWNKKEAPPDHKQDRPEDKVNYLWKKNKSWHMVINYDKVENKRKKKQPDVEREIFDLSKEIVSTTEGQLTDGKKLIEIINESLTTHKRDWLLSAYASKSQPMSYPTYRSNMRTLFKPLGKLPPQKAIRASYVNHFHALNISYADKQKIAKRMRHSVKIALRSYNKVDLDCDKPQSRKVAKQIEKHNIEQDTEIDVPPPVKRKYFDPREYGKKYRQKHAEKLRAKRKEDYTQNKDKKLKYKILFNLNHGLTTRPHQSTIKKYNLEHDAEKKRWFSRDDNE
jgi:hypothetical protein